MRPLRKRGFTLIELLVSIVIIGIIVSVAVLSLSLADDDREVREELRRLMAIMQLAQDDATLQGRDFGIEFYTGGYRFVEYDPVSGAWYDIIGDEVLRTRALPEGYEVRLYLEDKRILLDNDPVVLEVEDEDDPLDSSIANYAPHVFIFSSGDMTPFEVQFERTSDQVLVAMTADYLGNLEYLDDEDIAY